MLGKLIKLINKNGNYAYPITVSKAVYVSTDETLEQKLQTIETQISSPSPNLTASKWAGKIWNAVGDSITEHNFRTTKNYQDYIAEWIGCTVNNYGSSGTGWYCSGEFYDRIDDLNSNADLITVFGGTNDWAEVGSNLVLGNYGDTSGSTSFYGAVDQALVNLINKYPTKTIAVFTPIPRANAFNNAVNGRGITMTQVVDAIIKVCEKYSVPVLDLYRVSNLYPWNATANQAYFSCDSAPNGDGLHPNALGHEILAHKILTFLNSL